MHDTDTAWGALQAHHLAPDSRACVASTEAKQRNKRLLMSSEGGLFAPHRASWWLALNARPQQAHVIEARP
jgi:hypothetical protein